jgi:hypothetical protein
MSSIIRARSGLVVFRVVSVIAGLLAPRVGNPSMLIPRATGGTPPLVEPHRR